MRLLVAKTFPKGVHAALLSCLCNLFDLLRDLKVIAEILSLAFILDSCTYLICAYVCKS